MYWSVIGAFVAFEYVAEWLISWLPFYWEFKTLFLLFLALPQTQGSTFIYTTYLQPFFIKNEAQLDAGIVSIQLNILNFLQARLTSLWQTVWQLVNKSAAESSQSGNASPQSAAGGFSLQSAMALWQTYAPALPKPFSTPLPPTSRSTSQQNVNYQASQNPVPAGPPTGAPPFPVPQPFHGSQS